MLTSDWSWRHVVALGLCLAFLAGGQYMGWLTVEDVKMLLSGMGVGSLFPQLLRKA